MKLKKRVVRLQPPQSTNDVLVTTVGNTVLVPFTGKPKSGFNVVQPGDGG